MALLSTLSTAIDLVGAMRERRRGRDPSEQQSSEIALPSLAEGLRSLEHHIIALRTSIVAAENETNERVVLVRQMNDLILLSGVSRGMHGVHQHLMSLYPGVGEDLVEKARHLHRSCGGFLESEEPAVGNIIDFIDETVEFVAMTRSAVRQNGAFE